MVKEFELTEIFRLTPKLRKVALAIFPESRINEGNPMQGMKNADLKLCQFDDEEEEVNWVLGRAKSDARPGDPCVILFPKHEAIYDFFCTYAESKGLKDPPTGYGTGRRPKIKYGDEFRNYLRDNELDFVDFLGSGHGSLDQSDTKPTVFIMTFHSSKGLDFKSVFVPGMNSNVRIVRKEELEEDEDAEKRLLFVAVTRSRQNLFISYTSSKPHKNLRELPEDAIAHVKNPELDEGVHDEDIF